MNNKPLEVKAAMQIQKTAAEVFEAIVNPEIMKHFFISHGSARMEEGKVVNWQFPEFDGEFPVRIGKIEQNKYVSFYWDNADGTELFVEMSLTEQTNKSTVVRISEKGIKLDEAGLSWLVCNTEGWANFLACMKAWLEYGIHLRNGAFDFMKND